MAWIAAAGSVLGSLGASGAAKKAAKLEFQNQKKMSKLDAELARKNSQFDAELQHYYAQLEKKEKMRGLDEYRKFSTMSTIDPNYTNSNPGPEVPPMPVFNQGQYTR